LDGARPVAERGGCRLMMDHGGDDPSLSLIPMTAVRLIPTDRFDGAGK
jgi:hypothetical protein